MGDIKKALKWMDDHHRYNGNYPYSMYRRYGNPGFDCSSAVYYALIAGGFLPKNTPIGNTESLFALARRGKVLKEIYRYEDVQAGDIFIRGGEGSSSGANGHTGMFYKKDGIIHSNYTNNGISRNDMSSYLTYYLDRKRSWNERYFRPIPQNQPRQSVEDIAKRVLRGDFGNGQKRVDKIKALGYNYNEVQTKVNQLLSGNKYHIVKPGESLWSISKKYKTSVDTLVRLNGIRNRNLIRVGDKLRVR